MTAGTPRETSTRLKRTAREIHAALPELTTIECGFGVAALSEFRGKRGVVWISPGGGVEPSSRTNGTITDKAGKVERISIFANRIEDVEAHIYGETEEAVEALLDGVCAGIQQAVGVNNAPLPWKYGWAGDSQDAGGKLNHFPKVVLMFKLKLPVSEQALGLRSIEHIYHGHADKASDLPHTDPHGP